MGDILKEAIADAKAVRETALQNAKMALEEAFTPQLKNMLSAKLKEDEIEESEPVVEDEMGDEEEFGDEEEVPAEEVPAEEGTYEDEEFGDEEDFGGEDEEEVEEESLDLEAVIKELESELSEQEGEDEEAEEEPAVEEEYDITLEQEDEDEDEDQEEVEEQSDSSEIGTGDNKVDVADAGDEEDPGKGEMHEIKAELKEYKEAVHFLKDKLHEVNILNAKLLFTNKLFKEFSLNNNQKLKVVETFDRAQTTREIKLVYATLSEQFGDNNSINRKSINESASAKSGTTKPSKASRKVITEETQVANRFKKLAGLL